ncbi:unnamed protein product [Rotaria sordida]|uniref:Protein kinase domain-containing protein n=2 Tax=Rotaria sordida TaxID=392033 RepID=A0A814ANY1_9BILA|nr:unnamed protein product [Rotaria sordida]CAF1052340.1 unnamed protein product [Rotaria sordida]
MPSYPSPIPAPIFDSDESDVASQQSNDSSNYLSLQFNQYTRLSFSPQLNFDDNQDNFIYNNSIESTPTKITNSTNRKRKRTNDKFEYQTPNQSPYTRRKNLDYTQQITIQTPKIQRRSRNNQNQSPYINKSSSSSLTFTDLININPFKTKHHYQTRLVKKTQLLLKNFFIQRYEQEFHYELCLGSGEFSYVYLCKNRLDGLNYAIKISKNSLIGTSYEQQAWREICAYAYLSSHENLIRYYSGWIENDGKFFLQLEYCNGGSLDELIEKNRYDNKYLNEDILKNILHQICDVLTFMHKNDLAHLDIKPSNIMLCYYKNHEILYKLTDLGHVSQISLNYIDNDGDCRYLPLEILQKSSKINNLYLDKCDIYSLGLTLYVCGTNYIMPKQDNEWEEIRLNISKYLYTIKQCSKQFNQLIFERMCNIDPKQRPSAYELLIDPLVNPTIPTSRECLRHSLKQEREKNLLLNRKLLDQYILTNTSDLQTLPVYNDINNSDIQLQQNFHSPIPQYTLTPNNNSRILLINTPGCSTNINQSIASPISCSTLTIKQQQSKSTSSSPLRQCYSSVI